MEWSGKGFDHIYRRYVPVEIEPVPGGVRVAAELQYVWRGVRRGRRHQRGHDRPGACGTASISSWELTEVEGLTSSSVRVWG